MLFIFLGDSDHRALQEHQVATLKDRQPSLQVEFWDPSDMSLFSRLEGLPEPHLHLIGSRHGAVAAVHFTARHPRRVRRLVLLHPSLHLNLPYQPPPTPHFVPTLVICHSKEFVPSADLIAQRAGLLFHDYALHLTPEPPELRETLSLLAL